MSTPNTSDECPYHLSVRTVHTITNSMTILFPGGIVVTIGVVSHHESSLHQDCCSNHGSCLNHLYCSCIPGMLFEHLCYLHDGCCPHCGSYSHHRSCSHYWSCYLHHSCCCHNRSCLYHRPCPPRPLNTQVSSVSLLSVPTPLSAIITKYSVVKVSPGGLYRTLALEIVLAPVPGS